MAKRKSYRSRELGLEVGLLLARHLLQTENLHYGYWPEALAVELRNLPLAQDHYSDFLVSHVPAEAKSVLDIGCGAGMIADRLLRRGHEVECVAPESGLLACARKRLGDRAKVHADLFQQFEPGRTFDVLLFSESFQYVPLKPGLQHALDMLNPGGHIVICDFFKVPGKHKSPIGGGHRYEKFEQLRIKLGLEPLTDIDITPQTAPTMTLLNDFMQAVGAPSYALLIDHCRHDWPLTTRCVRWLFRKHLAKLERKHFSGARTAEAFCEYKTYRLLVLRQTAVNSASK